MFAETPGAGEKFPAPRHALDTLDTTVQKSTPAPERLAARAARAPAVKIGLIQHACGLDPEANVEKALRGIAEAARGGARIVCLQELFRTRYFCQNEDAANFELAEPVPGPTTSALTACAREHGITVVGSVFERRAPGLYHNTAVVLDGDGSLAGVYRKMHIPDDPSFLEKFYFTPGDAPAAGGAGFTSIPTRHANVAPLVCWDQWYPEAARLAALDGAEILLFPTAIGWLSAEKGAEGQTQREGWEVMHRAHAIANGVFVAAVNRVGVEGAIEFWGSSLVCDPRGRVIARASQSADEVLVAECDLSLIERTRRDWPFLRDRRVDAYSGLDRRYLDG